MKYEWQGGEISKTPNLIFPPPDVFLWGQFQNGFCHQKNKNIIKINERKENQLKSGFESTLLGKTLVENLRIFATAYYVNKVCRINAFASQF